MKQTDFIDGETNVARSLLTGLLEDSRLYRTSSDYMKLLEFVVKLRNFAPFNAMLLQIQKPGLMYAASSDDWHKRFNRSIKEGARPLLIMWPFGPVALVYDSEDTKGDNPLPADITETFRAKGKMSKEIIEGFVKKLARSFIYMKLIEYGDGHAGHIKVIKRSTNSKEKPEYQIRINAKHNPNVQFATLAHELGHLYLGHLGPDKYLKIPERPKLTEEQREIEAESLSYIICSRNGVQSKSKTYLCNYVKTNTTVNSLDLYVTMTASGQIERALDLAAKNKFNKK